MSQTLADRRPPLRTRRRTAVERIALDLALDQGYDAVTVESICDAALISTSTFFNYFGSKEQAMLGPRPEPLLPAQLASFASGAGDTMTVLMTALVAGWPVTEADRGVLLRRLDLIERTPSLRAVHHARLELASDEVERAALVRLGGGRAAATGEARMVVDLSHALMHWMIGRLRVEPTAAWSDLVARAVAQLRAVSGADR